MHSNWTETAEQIEARRRRIVAEANPHEWDTQPVKPVKKASLREKIVKRIDALFDVTLNMEFWRALLVIMIAALAVQVAITLVSWLAFVAAGG